MSNSKIGRVIIPEKHYAFWMERDRSNIRRCIRLFTMRNCDWFEQLHYR